MPTMQRTEHASLLRGLLDLCERPRKEGLSRNLPLHRPRYGSTMVDA